MFLTYTRSLIISFSCFIFRLYTSCSCALWRANLSAMAGGRLLPRPLPLSAESLPDGISFLQFTLTIAYNKIDI